MTVSNATEYLGTIIRTQFEEGRCGDYYLVDLEIRPPAAIAVFIDGDAGVSLEACTKVSRSLAAVLDEDGLYGNLYSLEVSSPGVSRSLVFPRQYVKHVGRHLRLTLKNGETMEGKLTESTPESITIVIPPVEKKGSPVTKVIPFEAIHTAFVVVKF